MSHSLAHRLTECAAERRQIHHRHTIGIMATILGLSARGAPSACFFSFFVWPSWSLVKGVAPRRSATHTTTQRKARKTTGGVCVSQLVSLSKRSRGGKGCRCFRGWTRGREGTPPRARIITASFCFFFHKRASIALRSTYERDERI